MSKALRKWQLESVEAVESHLAQGDRPLVQAVMGAGKSIALSELAQRAFRHDHHVVVTVPTQELVRQLAETMQWWTGQPVGQWYADCHELWPMTVVSQMSIHSYEEAWRAKYAAPSRLWIADEAHRTECETMLTWEAPELRVGFSATPWRASDSEAVSAFDVVAYEYSAQDALRDGHVVRPDLHHPVEGEIDEVVAAWVRDQRDLGGGVVNASSIADAEKMARRLDAVAVHSESALDARSARDVIKEGGAVVYVDMLAEGFDCPEIRWMALRRPVGSRVRFAQEVGRGLRSCPRLGKEDCKMLDVYDLWNVHALNWRAALGEIEDEVVPALKLDWMLDQTGWTGCGGSSPVETMPPELLSPLRSWVRAERVRALCEGRIGVKKITSTHWRSDPCSRKQLAYLDDVMRVVDPSRLDPGMVRRIRTARAALVDCLQRDPLELHGAFRKGDASDLIDIVRGLRG